MVWVLSYETHSRFGEVLERTNLAISLKQSRLMLFNFNYDGWPRQLSVFIPHHD